MGEVVMTHEQAHSYARQIAASLVAPDRKQLRFNEIVETAFAFYPEDVRGGIRDLLQSCDTEIPALHVKGQPMWKTLRDSYGWMIDAPPQRDQSRRTRDGVAHNLAS